MQALPRALHGITAPTKLLKWVFSKACFARPRMVNGGHSHIVADDNLSAPSGKLQPRWCRVSPSCPLPVGSADQGQPRVKRLSSGSVPEADPV